MRIRILVPLLLIALGATAQGKKTVFSTMETNHIRVATPGLFSQRELIELPLEDIPDTEYSFPCLEKSHLPLRTGSGRTVA